MTVKTIFKVLIGTVVIMVCSFLMIEIFNVSIVSVQIRNLTSLAAKQACALYLQETYKERANGGTINVAPILDEKQDVNHPYLDGKFYDYTDPMLIYKDIVVDSHFLNLIRTGADYSTNSYVYEVSGFNSTSGSFRLAKSGNKVPVINYFTNIKLLNDRIVNGGDFTDTALNWLSDEAQIQQNINHSRANTYYNNMYTPANLGFPYINVKTANRMFQYNLTDILRDGKDYNVKATWNAGKAGTVYAGDADKTMDLANEGLHSVYYKGFNCYTRSAVITGIDYYIFDLSDKNGNGIIANSDVKIAASAGLGLNVRGINQAGSGIVVRTEQDLVGNQIKDNAIIAAAEVKYSLPVKYEGITPIKRLFAFVVDKQVEGMGDDGHFGSYTKYSIDDIAPNLGSNGASSNTSYLRSDNVDLPNTAIPSSGKVMITLVK